MVRVIKIFGVSSVIFLLSSLNVYAQENTPTKEPITFFEVLLAILVPCLFLVIAYLIVKLFKS